MGTVSATDPNTGDAVSYSIIRDSSDGKFAIDGSTGEITVAEALDSRTASSYTLTTEAQRPIRRQRLCHGDNRADRGLGW